MITFIKTLENWNENDAFSNIRFVLRYTDQAFPTSSLQVCFTWNTKQFCALVTMPIFSSSSRYLARLTRSPSREYSDDSPANARN